MISRVRLFEAVMIGPTSCQVGEPAVAETTTLPTRRPGITCEMTLCGYGILVAWKAGEKTGEVLVPWVNVRDVMGENILGAIVVDTYTIADDAPLPENAGKHAAPLDPAEAKFIWFDGRIRANAADIAITRPSGQTTTLAKVNEAERTKRIRQWFADGVDPLATPA